MGGEADPAVTATSREGGGTDRDCDTKARSFEQLAQRAAPMGDHVSHCPQTIPISASSACKFLRPRELPSRQWFLDVRGKSGQADGVTRLWKAQRVVFAAALVFSAACAKKSPAVQVADAFVDAYFAHADQEKAKEYTAFTATAMLDEEEKQVAGLRHDGYGPSEAGANVSCRRSGESTMRGERVRVPYECTVHSEAGDTMRDADIELAEINGAWKVVRIGLTNR